MKKMKKHDTIPGTGAGRNLVSLLAGMALIISIITITSCKTTEVIGETAPDFTEENQKFLEVDEKAREVFRVLLTSDEYTVSQMKYDKLINRSKDPGGDKYMSDEVKRMDTIYAAREGVFTVWIYPDSGKLMQIRPQRSTFIIEADKLIMEDIQRWSFGFPKKVITPTKFDIKYRVVLRKKLSDKEILEEVGKRMNDE